MPEQPAPVPSGAAAPVVVSVRPPWRLVATLLGGVVLVGLLWAVVDAVRFGQSHPWRRSGLGSGGTAVGWVIVALVGIVLLAGVVGAWSLRFELTPGGIRGRALTRWQTFPSSSIERLRFKAASRTVAPRPASARLWVRDQTGHRRTVNLAFGLTNAADALPILLGWAGQRPELVRDDATRTTVAALTRSALQAGPVG